MPSTKGCHHPQQTQPQQQLQLDTGGSIGGVPNSSRGPQKETEAPAEFLAHTTSTSNSTSSNNISNISNNNNNSNSNSSSTNRQFVAGRGAWASLNWCPAQRRPEGHPCNNTNNNSNKPTSKGSMAPVEGATGAHGGCAFEPWRFSPSSEIGGGTPRARPGIKERSRSLPVPRQHKAKSIQSPRAAQAEEASRGGRAVAAVHFGASEESPAVSRSRQRTGGALLVEACGAPLSGEAGRGGAPVVSAQGAGEVGVLAMGEQKPSPAPLREQQTWGAQGLARAGEFASWWWAGGIPQGVPEATGGPLAMCSSCGGATDGGSATHGGGASDWTEAADRGGGAAPADCRRETTAEGGLGSASRKYPLNIVSRGAAGGCAPGVRRVPSDGSVVPEHPHAQGPHTGSPDLRMQGAHGTGAHLLVHGNSGNGGPTPVHALAQGSERQGVHGAGAGLRLQGGQGTGPRKLKRRSSLGTVLGGILEGACLTEFGVEAVAVTRRLSLGTEDKLKAHALAGGGAPPEGGAHGAETPPLHKQTSPDSTAHSSAVDSGTVDSIVRLVRRRSTGGLERRPSKSSHGLRSREGSGAWIAAVQEQVLKRGRASLARSREGSGAHLIGIEALALERERERKLPEAEGQQARKFPGMEGEMPHSKQLLLLVWGLLMSAAVLFGSLLLGAATSAAGTAEASRFGVHVTLVAVALAFGIMLALCCLGAMWLVSERLEASKGQLLEELCALRECEEGLRHAKKEFLGSVSHEIRTPLNGIIGMLQYLIDEGTLGEEEQEALDTALLSCWSLVDWLANFVYSEMGVPMASQQGRTQGVPGAAQEGGTQGAPSAPHQGVADSDGGVQDHPVAAHQGHTLGHKAGAAGPQGSPEGAVAAPLVSGAAAPADVAPAGVAPADVAAPRAPRPQPPVATGAPVARWRSKSAVAVHRPGTLHLHLPPPHVHLPGPLLLHGHAAGHTTGHTARRTQAGGRQRGAAPLQGLGQGQGQGCTARTPRGRVRRLSLEEPRGIPESGPAPEGGTGMIPVPGAHIGPQSGAQAGAGTDRGVPLWVRRRSADFMADTGAVIGSGGRAEWGHAVAVPAVPSTITTTGTGTGTGAAGDSASGWLARRRSTDCRPSDGAGAPGARQRGAPQGGIPPLGILRPAEPWGLSGSLSWAPQDSGVPLRGGQPHTGGALTQALLATPGSATGVPGLGGAAGGPRCGTPEAGAGSQPSSLRLLRPRAGRGRRAGGSVRDPRRGSLDLSGAGYSDTQGASGAARRDMYTSSNEAQCRTSQTEIVDRHTVLLGSNHGAREGATDLYSDRPQPGVLCSDTLPSETPCTDANPEKQGLLRTEGGIPAAFLQSSSGSPYSDTPRSGAPTPHSDTHPEEQGPIETGGVPSAFPQPFPEDQCRAILKSLLASQGCPGPGPLSGTPPAHPRTPLSLRGRPLAGSPSRGGGRGRSAHCSPPPGPCYRSLPRLWRMALERDLASCQGDSLASCQGHSLASCQGHSLASCQGELLASCQGEGLASCQRDGQETDGNSRAQDIACSTPEASPCATCQDEPRGHSPWLGSWKVGNRTGVGAPGSAGPGAAGGACGIPPPRPQLWLLRAPTQGAAAGTPLHPQGRSWELSEGSLGDHRASWRLGDDPASWLPGTRGGLQGETGEGPLAPPGRPSYEHASAAGGCSPDRCSSMPCGTPSGARPDGTPGAHPPEGCHSLPALRISGPASPWGPKKHPVHPVHPVHRGDALAGPVVPGGSGAGAAGHASGVPRRHVPSAGPPGEPDASPGAGCAPGAPLAHQRSVRARWQERLAQRREGRVQREGSGAGGVLAVVSRGAEAGSVGAGGVGGGSVGAGGVGGGSVGAGGVGGGSVGGGSVGGGGVGGGSAEAHPSEARGSGGGSGTAESAGPESLEGAGSWAGAEAAASQARGAEEGATPGDGTTKEGATSRAGDSGAAASEAVTTDKAVEGVEGALTESQGSLEGARAAEADGRKADISDAGSVQPLTATGSGGEDTPPSAATWQPQGERSPESLAAQRPAPAQDTSAEDMTSASAVGGSTEARERTTQAAVPAVQGGSPTRGRGSLEDGPGGVLERLKGKKALVVDDNTVNRRVLVAKLRRYGLECLQAADGKEAVEAFDKATGDPFVCVFMDLQMPVMDGYESTKQIRMLEGERGVLELPVFAVTADVVTGTEERCLSAGMNGLLTKPLSGKDLKAVLVMVAEKITVD